MVPGPVISDVWRFHGSRSPVGATSRSARFFAARNQLDFSPSPIVSQRRPERNGSFHERILSFLYQNATSVIHLSSRRILLSIVKIPSLFIFLHCPILNNNLFPAGRTYGGNLRNYCWPGNQEHTKMYRVDA